jgi:hypothetical protein
MCSGVHAQRHESAGTKIKSARDVPVAVEVRNKTWMAPTLGDCLREHNAVGALPDQA